MDIAIIGLGVEAPGTTDPDVLWQLAARGESLARPLPSRRREDIDEYVRYLAASNPATAAEVVRPAYHQASYLDRIDLFDHEFFGMTPAQAAVTDPHQRLVLRTIHRALDDAGWSGPRIAGSRTGVFVGFAANPGAAYADYCTRIDPSMTQLGITGNIPTMLANRISYLLDLHGPSLVVDSACSASLVAVHQARAALVAGDCDLAVVAGTRIVLLPVDRPTTRIGIESSDGATRTFDESADGTGLGEGSAALVLRRLDDALAAGDHVHAVLKGGAVNHDGRSEAMTSPDATSQAELLQAAWRSAGIDPRTIGYIEVHGTATRIGDPIEIEGLTRAFAAAGAGDARVAVGTAKTTFGHLFEGSGALAVVKAVQGLRHRQIAPLAHLREPNARIDFEASPARLPTTLEEWPAVDGTPRRCGISAFGLGGTNAHVVLEEAPELPATPAAGPGPRPLALSARTEKSLRLTARDLLERVELGDLDDSLDGICRTLTISRTHHRLRRGLVVHDMAGLRTGLRAFADGVPLPASADPADTGLEALLARWQAGEGATLHELLEPAGMAPVGRTVPLPPYVFDETRAWPSFPRDWRRRLGLEPHPQSGAYSIEFATVPPAPPAPEGALVVAVIEAGDPHGAGALLAAAVPGLRLLALEPGEDSEAAAEHIARCAVEAGATHLIFAVAGEQAPAAAVAELDRRVEKNLVGLFLLAKALMTQAARLRLAVLTCGALPTPPAAGGAVAENAALAGLVKTLAQEYPGLSPRLVDADPGAEPGDLARELLGGRPGAFALRGGQVLGERFAEIADLAPPADGGASRLRPGGAWLITGGTGGLGLAIARHLARACPGVQLSLTGRSPLPPAGEWEHLARRGGPLGERLQSLLEVEALGARVQVRQGDAGDERHLAELLAQIRADHGRLDGIVHAAGVPGQNLVMFRDLADFRRVLRPKMRGAYLLHALTRDEPPGVIVHMSSAAAVFPSPGQGDYASANYYLDALAASHPGPAGSVAAIDWVAWRDTGMAVATGANEDSVFRALRTPEGLDLFAAALTGGRARFLAGHIDYDGELVGLLPTSTVELAPEISGRLEEAAAAAAERIAQAAERTRATVLALDVELTGRAGGYTVLETLVARCAAQATGVRRVPVDADLRDLGVDSLAVMAVTTSLGACLGYDVDAADLLAGRTVEGIAEAIEVGYGGLADLDGDGLEPADALLA